MSKQPTCTNTCAQSHAGTVDYPRFTKKMKATHKLLLPQMSPIHFRMIAEVFRHAGYDVDVLENAGPSVVHAGQQYVHNDACYPAILVIGQFIDALKSGKYDLDRTALLITQTGGGCRASNYIHMLRKALIKAGFPQIPVASLNFSGLERGAGFRLSFPMMRKALAACLYGDALMSLSNQTRPYEIHPDETDALVTRYQAEIIQLFAHKRGYGKRDMQNLFRRMAQDFSNIPLVRTPKTKVGVVGEIYVKYSPVGNNHLEEFLRKEDCEVNVPGLLGFVQYCVSNAFETIHLYGGNKFTADACQLVLDYINTREKMMLQAIEKYSTLHAPSSFMRTRALAERVINLGVKMGEGWLLTGEMAELIESGFFNIVCAQPFGCLPNHIVGKGMIKKLRTLYPAANITPIDYDPSATRVNQENRIKLMLASAAESARIAKSTLHAAQELATNRRTPPDFMSKVSGPVFGNLCL